MTDFTSVSLPVQPSAVAPDGTDVRLLPRLEGGSMAHFVLRQGKTSKAVTHRSVEEIWFFLSGQGEFWRRQGDREEVVPVRAGSSLTIPRGTHFQFRSIGDAPLTMIAATMPPWPGAEEAVVVEGPWIPTVN